MGTVELFYGDVPVGTGRIARTTPLTYGIAGFAIGFRPGQTIHPGLNGRAELSPTVLRRVVVESAGHDGSDNPMAESRVELATQ